MRPWFLKARPGLPVGTAVVAILVAAMLLWLWPIGIGGMMPVGGDVTQFFLGLMGVLSAALERGHLPVWNPLWGYGFPAIGESQMGVYYPPHLLLYGWLGTEQAYVASLVLHTVWGAVGAWWAARRFGVSAIGSALAAFAFSASGFFVIHMPHPWGYTTGCWLPWAWGLAWSILDPPRAGLPLKLFLLTVVLVLQLLPGHFQIGFMTQVGIVLMVLWALGERLFRARTTEVDGAPARQSGGIGAAFLVLACLAVVPVLAAVQLWPTARLALHAADQRDFNYLSLCASTPLHLVNLVAPGFFHRSVLWRELVWTPFHTSPEEHLTYVGLAPLFLGVLAAGREFRRDHAVRVLAVLALVTLLLSLGPFIPGFRLLISVPGFSFFRAPARWGETTSLALALLAGKGLDACRNWPRLGPSLASLAALAILWVGLTLGLVELALASGSSADRALTSVFDMAFRMRPWKGDPSFRSVAAQARLPFSDPTIPPELERMGVASRPRDPRSFVSRRVEIYRDELAVTAMVLAGILSVALLAQTGSGRTLVPACLLLLTLVDLLTLSRHRLVEIARLRPLVEQSPVLARLAGEPRGTRVVDRTKNLAMLVGLGPVSAYRTLDLPALVPLSALAQAPLSDPKYRGLVLKATRAVGAGVRVLDPIEVAAESRQSGPAPLDQNSTAIDDPALAGWIHGPSWAREQGSWAVRFRVIHPVAAPVRAWFVPLTAIARPEMLDSWNGDVEALLKVFDAATPLESASDSPLRLDVAVEVESPGWVIVTQLADPQWQARWSGAGAEYAPGEVLATFRRGRTDGGWQRVRVPEPGRWVLHLDYVATDVRQGMLITAVALPLWVIVLTAFVILSRRRGEIP
jgi:hypothetical protein